MIILKSFSLLIMALCLVVFPSGETSVENLPAQEFHMREGLPNFFDKAEKAIR